MKPLRILAPLVMLLIWSGCATKIPYNPFKITEDEFYGKIKTIALAPVDVPVDLENTDQVKARFESLVEAKLREAGFAVIPPREYAETWERAMKQMGGYFDPVTGKRDESKFKAVKESSLRELQEKFHADAVLYSGTRVVSVEFHHDKASWDGTSESLSTSGWTWLLGTHSGTTPALSFSVLIVSASGNNAFFNMGGIQVLDKISGGKLVMIPQNELLASDERNTAAVNHALEPLVRRTKSSPVPSPKP